MTDPIAPANQITRVELVALYSGLEKALEKVTDPSASYTMAWARRLLKPYIAQLDELQKQPARVDEFQKKRGKLLLEYSEKDRGGDPVMSKTATGQLKYEIDEKRAADFRAASDALAAEYKQDTEAWNEKIEGLNKLMDAPMPDLDISTLPKIAMSWFKGGLTGTVLSDLFPILHNDIGADGPQPEAAPEGAEKPKAKGKKA